MGFWSDAGHQDLLRLISAVTGNNIQNKHTALTATFVHRLFNLRHMIVFKIFTENILILEYQTIIFITKMYQAKCDLCTGHNSRSSYILFLFIIQLSRHLHSIKSGLAELSLSNIPYLILIYYIPSWGHECIYFFHLLFKMTLLLSCMFEW